MTIIELGEAYGAEPVEPPPPAVRRRGLRRWGSAAVLALLLGTVAGAAPAPRPVPLAGIDAAPGAAIALAEGRLLVVEPPGVSAERSTTVAAYRLPDAAPLWRTTLSRPLPGTVRLVGITHEVVLVTADPPVNSPSGEADAVALTVGTGTETWWGPLGDAAFTAGGDLLLMDGADGGLRFRSVAARTGAERWSYRLPPEAIWSVGVRRDRAVDLVVGLPSGRVERRSTDTGAVLAAADLPRPARGNPGRAGGSRCSGTCCWCPTAGAARPRTDWTGSTGGGSSTCRATPAGDGRRTAGRSSAWGARRRSRSAPSTGGPVGRCGNSRTGSRTGRWAAT
ncbi:PQQ-binding-like beta-propeller repeat protein [Micromonospora zhanjiangensis]